MNWQRFGIIVVLYLIFLGYAIFCFMHFHE
jgi:hypothetical protein